jgi:hypothetical protein
MWSTDEKRGVFEELGLRDNIQNGCQFEAAK